MMIERKFKRPVKVANTWPGKTKLNFTHPGIQYPWKFHCPQPLCFYVVVAADEATIDKRIETHTCPWFGGGTTTFSWGTMSDDFLQPIWKMLDASVDVLKSPNATAEEKIAARFGGRGLAEALAILMPPFFKTGDEIVKEAIVRWENRQAGTDYETPGLGRFKFKRPPGVIGDPDNPSWVTKPEYDAKEPKPAPKYDLDEAAIAAIKKGKAFPAQILMAAYGVSLDVIKYIQEH
jgi:hypothetical protein